MQQHKWVIPNPSVTVCLANRQRAEMFIEYPAKERKNVERRKCDTGHNGGRDGRDETPNE